MATKTEVVEGFDGFEDYLKDLSRDFLAATFTNELERFQRTLEEAHLGGFHSGMSPTTEQWAPLAPSTVKKKGHATILVDTGKLQRSLTDAGAEDAIRDIIAEPPQHGLVFGTSVEYAGFHQFGTVRIPQREHVGMGEEELDELVNLVADGVVRALTSEE